MSPPSVLVVEDDRSAGAFLELLLQREGYEAVLVTDGVEAMVALEANRFDLVISDLHMPNMDGMELLAHIRQRWADLPVIIITAASDVSDVVKVVKLGATNYLVKPVATPVVVTTVKKALNARAAALPPTRSITELVGNSRSIVEVRHQVTLAARSDVPVLITGRTGTGKELVARAIHRYSSLADGPFLAHNCAVAPRDLFESQFFGHHRGSFTGADRDHVGLLAQADGGVLFLDELETLTREHQAKLLRVLDDGEVRPVGSEQSLQVSVRFTAATNMDPAQLIDEGSLREDLYYRLRGFEIVLPPLSERREDIPLLATHFLDSDADGFTPDALEALTSAPWPGNVRQLRNAVRSAAAAAGSDKIGIQHLLLDRASFDQHQGPSPTPTGIPRGTTLRALERQAILQALEDCNGNRSRAARILDIDRSTLRRKLQEFGIGSKK
jgi:DNA-binding NtrC family response regulator